ncbi:MAG: hypothetical protein ACR2FM_00290 [Candidatus Saccharimonadales bacterium]
MNKVFKLQTSWAPGLHKRGVAFFFALLLMFAAVLPLTQQQQRVYAATKAAEYTLYWDDANKNALKAIFDDGEKQTEIGNKMVIAAKGDLFGDKGSNFSFDPAVNTQLNKAKAVGGETNSDNYYATSKVYCSGNNLSLTPPTSKPYKVIDYTLGFHVNDWNNVQNDPNYKLYAGITKINEIGGTGQADRNLFTKGSETLTSRFNPSKLGDDGDHNGNGGDAKDHISSACFNALSRGDLGGSKLRNFYKLSPAEQAEVKGIATTGSGAGAGGGAAGCSGGTCAKDCDSSEGVPLSWIVCPLVDMGAKFSDFAFTKIIQPLLADVPVSTNPKDPSYKAWTSFRILANVMLVGTLLVVVYSQAKGGK